MANVGKTQVVAAIAAQTGVTKKTAAQMIEALLEMIVDEVKRGNKISFQGFGSFSKGHRKARMGVNPKTGEKIKIPATDVAKFTVGSEFKAAVKGK